VHPSVTEQLRGVRRTLTEVVAPDLSHPYPTEVLRGVVAALEGLERSWVRVLPFLTWDNAATATLLREQVAPAVDAPLAARISAALEEPEPDPLDVDAADARNEALRGLLADAVPQLTAGGDATAGAHAAVVAHLRARIERFPLTMNAPMPGR
jgi:hypothetical protein